MAISEHLRMTAEAMGVQPITRQKLFALVREPYERQHPIHLAEDFVDEATGFQVVTRAQTRWVEPRVTRQEIAERIDQVCVILTALQARNSDNSPFFSLNETAHAYSTILSLLVHGCLGMDGHGRMLVRMLPITLNIAGYGHLSDESQFTNSNGSFSINVSTISMFLMYGQLDAGIRNFAALTQIERVGDTDVLYQNPLTAWRRTERNQVVREAIKFSLTEVGKYIKKKLRSTN